MSRIALILFLFPISIFAQASTPDVATAYAYKVVPGKTYLVSVMPEGRADAVIGVGSDLTKPLTVINNQRIGVSETYKVQALSNELQVSVFVNSDSGKHTIAVLGEDGKFPFYKWSRKYGIVLKTDSEGFIESFGFKWLKAERRESKASSDINTPQYVAAGSAILYTFRTHPQFPLDIMVVPATNHLDLALQIGNEGEYELNDNDRNPSDIQETRGGQIEWVQYAPTGDSINVIVVNRSDFGGSFKMSVRVLFNDRPALRPLKWKVLDKNGLDQLLEKSRSKLPLINDDLAATFSIEPSRTIKSFVFGAIALEPGLNFGIIIRFDPDKPPLFLQAGGDYTRAVEFQWKYDNGFLEIDDSGTKYRGVAENGKLEISIIGFGGESRVGVLLQDETFAPLPQPKHLSIPRKDVSSLLSKEYEEFEVAAADLRIYRYEAEVGESYSVQVNPMRFFDPVLLDPSIRNFERPTALRLVDEKGWGKPERLETTATVDFIEFAVVGARYERGAVSVDNKRLGGTGFYSLEVKDSKGNTPKLREKLHVTLPNELVLKELDLLYQPWDPFEKREASKLAPFSVVVDEKVKKALNHPLEPKPDTANNSKPKN
ncbi:MAG: hypothetical protein HKN33_18505 [Pyrinomonadaceae bacterium]|nr:hypothetical protein [Pyrinomonadaceae bacterium]